MPLVTAWAWVEGAAHVLVALVPAGVEQGGFLAIYELQQGH